MLQMHKKITIITMRCSVKHYLHDNGILDICNDNEHKNVSQTYKHTSHSLRGGTGFNKKCTYLVTINTNSR